jgi:hypothetical protein
LHLCCSPFLRLVIFFFFENSASCDLSLWWWLARSMPTWSEKSYLCDNNYNRKIWGLKQGCNFPCIRTRSYNVASSVLLLPPVW